MAKKPSIPPASSSDQSVNQAILAIKENIEIMNGSRGGEIGQLGSDATTATIISKINEIIAKLNVSG